MVLAALIKIMIERRGRNEEEHLPEKRFQAVRM